MYLYGAKRSGIHTTYDVRNIAICESMALQCTQDQNTYTKVMHQRTIVHQRTRLAHVDQCWYMYSIQCHVMSNNYYDKLHTYIATMGIGIDSIIDSIMGHGSWLIYKA